MPGHAVAVGSDALVDFLDLKGAFHRAQHAYAGPERIGERDRIEVQARRLEPGLEMPALVGEFARRRALERKDRLLLVADREDRAGDAVARAFAGSEFGNDVSDDVPLPGAGVLRLVDQH